MHRTLLISSLALLSVTSCQEVVDDINNNPNALGVDDIDAGLYLNSPELGVVGIATGVLPTITTLWTGQLVGLNQTYLQYYLYNVNGSTFSFDGYHDIILQCHFIQQRTPDNGFYQGVTRVLEAMLFGTYASLFGDVPCSEAATDEPNPHFDSQLQVFDHVQQLLDQAIHYLQDDQHPSYRQDYLYNGNVAAWIEAAYTLKGRYYTLTKQYDKAFASAQHGISSEAHSMRFVPADDSQVSNKNRFYRVNLTNQGYATSSVDGTQSYLMDLLDRRKNSKTDESARKAYYYTDPAISTSANGFISALEPEPIVTYSENLLILAETAARTQGLTQGLRYLNEQRAFLATGGYANTNKQFSHYPHQYDPLEAEDFEAGGLLNAQGNLSAQRALLREIIEERYVSGFCTFTPFDDARRLRGAKETNVAVDFPLNTPNATAQPERLFYPQSEIISNVNAPVDPGLYSPTPVNR